MRNIRTILLLNAILACCSLASAKSVNAQPPENDQTKVGFEQVRPILKKHCAGCHNGDELRGGLDLTTFSGVIAGSDSGSSVTPGRPDESLLLLVTTHQADPKMPPNSPKIPAREIEVIRKWIKDLTLSETTPAPTMESDPSTPNASSSVSGSAAASGFRPITPLSQPTPFAALSASPTEPTVALAGRKQVILLDVASQQFKGAIDIPEGDVTSLRYTRDGALLLVGCGKPGLSGKIVAFDTKLWTRKFELGDENDSILAVDMSSDGKLVAIGGPKKVVKVFQVEDGNLLYTMKRHTDWILSLSFSPDSLLLASSDRFGGVFVMEAATGEEFATLRGHTGSVSAIAWNNSTDQLLTSGQDGSLRMWSMHTKELMSTWKGNGKAILDLAYLGENLWGIAGRDRKLQKIRFEATKLAWLEEQQSQDLEDEVNQLECSADGKLAICSDAKGKVYIIDNSNLQKATAILPAVDQQLQIAIKKRIAEMTPSAEELASIRSFSASPIEAGDTEAAITVDDTLELILSENQSLITEAEKTIARLKEQNRRIEALLKTKH